MSTDNNGNTDNVTTKAGMRAKSFIPLSLTAIECRVNLKHHVSVSRDDLPDELFMYCRLSYYYYNKLK